MCVSPHPASDPDQAGKDPIVRAFKIADGEALAEPYEGRATASPQVGAVAPALVLSPAWTALNR